jgi:hypothetical protein
MTNLILEKKEKRVKVRYNKNVIEKLKDVKIND